MISVIIPALNEEKTIANVVRFCLSDNRVGEVIVVDDASEDNTAAMAENAGAKIINSKTRGKGISMREGIDHSANEMLIFLDGDIDPYPEETISTLAAPLLTDESDFVKGAFARNAGRVTELVAKPLLNIFYPSLGSFSQPLSGMIAGKKKFLNRINFFNDYGVDVGILIDMYLMKARIKEVNIGYIENNSKPWEALGKMSREVARAIITKAQQQNNNGINEKDAMNIKEINNEMHKALQENLSAGRRMMIFDMDDTILQGRFIDACAKHFRFTAKLEDLREQETDAMILTKRIALLLQGRTIDELLTVAQSIEMITDVKEVVSGLKQKGCTVGIISNSYTLITNYIAKNIGADFSLANQLEIFEGIATGEVNIPSYFFALPESICGHSYCKTNALQYACEKYGILISNCIAIGDGKDDRCIIGHAGNGIAFRTNDELLRRIAKKEIKETSFHSLLAAV